MADSSILDQLKNRRLKQLSKEEKQWQDILSKAQQRLDELKEREVNLTNNLNNLQFYTYNYSL